MLTLLCVFGALVLGLRVIDAEEETRRGDYTARLQRLRVHALKADARCPELAEVLRGEAARLDSKQKKALAVLKSVLVQSVRALRAANVAGSEEDLVAIATKALPTDEQELLARSRRVLPVGGLRAKQRALLAACKSGDLDTVEAAERAYLSILVTAQNVKGAVGTAEAFELDLLLHQVACAKGQQYTAPKVEFRLANVEDLVAEVNMLEDEIPAGNGKTLVNV